MKKIITLSIFAFALCIGAKAQTPSTQLGFYAGYAYPSQERMTAGLDLGLEFRKYLHNNLYFTAVFHYDEARGYSQDVKHPQVDAQMSNVSYEINYTTLAAGLGYRLPIADRHSVYVQAALGVSDINRIIDYNFINGIELHSKYLPSKHPFYRTGLGVSGLISAGYDFKILPWAALGLQYSLMIPDKYVTHGLSAKLSVLFN